MVCKICFNDPLSKLYFQFIASQNSLICFASWYYVYSCLGHSPTISYSVHSSRVHSSYQDHFQCHRLCQAPPDQVSEQKRPPLRSLVSTIITSYCKLVSPKLVMSEGPEMMFFFLYTILGRYSLNVSLKVYEISKCLSPKDTTNFRTLDP